MPKGYYTGYSYCGVMPDGRKAYFASDTEYREAFEEEAKETKPSLFRTFFNAFNGTKLKLKEEYLWQLKKDLLSVIRWLKKF